MHLIQSPSKQGYVWFRQGLWLFKRNPMGFLMLIFLYLLVVQLSMLIPIVGVVVVLTLAPGIFAGLMDGCRDTILGERVRPLTLVSAFRKHGGQAARRLLALGLLHTTLVMVLSLVATSLIDVQALVPMVLQQQEPTIEGIRQLYFALGVGLVLYTPVVMLIWFSPLLIIWEGIPPGKALFFSWIACWRNRGAFLAYLSIWAVCLIALPLFIESLLQALDVSDVGSLVLIPYTVVMTAIMYCSVYASWKSCFQEAVADDVEDADGVVNQVDAASGPGGQGGGDQDPPAPPGAG
ncbi:MAG: hypothetical protein MO847_05285 [Candidatus Protistobacter heckmanni]|nr:hypothetical protein [Candidatus Protistobacter heckmanni]